MHITKMTAIPKYHVHIAKRKLILKRTENHTSYYNIRSYKINIKCESIYIYSYRNNFILLFLHLIVLQFSL